MPPTKENLNTTTTELFRTNRPRKPTPKPKSPDLPPIMREFDCTELFAAIYRQLYSDFIYASKVALKANQTHIPYSAEYTIKECTQALINLNRALFAEEDADRITSRQLAALLKGKHPNANPNSPTGRTNHQLKWSKKE